MSTITERVLIRFPEIETNLLEELETTALDRITLRLGVSTFPEELSTIAVEVICALYNRLYYAGIESEDADTFSVSFVDDILKEYEKDFTAYLNNLEKQKNENKGVLRFR